MVRQPDVLLGLQQRGRDRSRRRSRAGSTEDEQTEKLRAANEQIAADAASAWLYLYPQIVVARSNVSGYGVNGLNLQFVVSGISKN